MMLRASLDRRQSPRSNTVKEIVRKRMSEPTSVVSVPVAPAWSDPSAPRPIDAFVTNDAPDMAAWLAALGTAERLDLLGRAETQALMGEPVIVLGERDGWSEVRFPWQPSSKDSQGYPAWIRSAHIASEAPLSPALPKARISARLVIGECEQQGPIVLSGGTHLAIVELGSQTSRLQTPGGAIVCVTNDALSLDVAVPVRGSIPFVPEPMLVDTASAFLGLPYLWGGLSGWGVDCSGLVHLASRMLGSIIPRDSGDMRADHLSTGITPTAGELLFFRYQDERQRIHHVAITANEKIMLHAPRTGRVVELLPIETAPYAEELERALAT
jgi:gamma-D-glutamyl-L-lysine dipeptidyl-peptidase